MPESQLPEYLQFHGQASKTGCLSVTTESHSGQIYLHHGRAVYAETGDSTGLLALYTILVWATPKIEWFEGMNAPKMVFNESVDSVLFQLAQLEDNNQTDPTSLLSIFEAMDSKSEEIKFTDLKNYIVSFEVLNTDFKGFIFYLQKEKNLIGRAEDCDIILPDASVSAHHAIITVEPTCIRVADLGSTNGCFIRGKLISDDVLQVGDEFSIGAVSLQMSLKMRRHIAVGAQDGVNKEGAQSVPGTNAPRKLSADPGKTIQIDLSSLRNRTKKITGPITWKNINENEDTKKKMTGIFGKMFNRKD